MSDDRISYKDIIEDLRSYDKAFQDAYGGTDFSDYEIAKDLYDNDPAFKKAFGDVIVFNDWWSEVAAGASDVMKNLGEVNPIDIVGDQFQALAHPGTKYVELMNRIDDLPSLNLKEKVGMDEAKGILSLLDPASIPMQPLVNWFQTNFNRLDEKKQRELLNAIPPTVLSVLLASPLIIGSLAPGVATSLGAKALALSGRAILQGLGQAGVEGISQGEQKNFNAPQLATSFGIGVTAELLNAAVAKALSSLGGGFDRDENYRKGIVEKLSRLFANNKTPTPTEVYDSVAQLDLPLDVKRSLEEEVKLLMRRFNEGGPTSKEASDAIKRFHDRLVDPLTSLEAVQQFKGMLADMLDPKKYTQEMAYQIEAMSDIIRRAINSTSDATSINLRSLLTRTLGSGLVGMIIGGIVPTISNIKKVIAERSLEPLKGSLSKAKTGAEIGGGIGAGLGALATAQPIIQTSPLAQQLISKGIFTANKAAGPASEFVLRNPAMIEPLSNVLGTRAMSRMPPSLTEKPTPQPKGKSLTETLGEKFPSLKGLAKTLKERNTKNVPMVSSQVEYDSLKSGDEYQDLDGNIRRKK